MALCFVVFTTAFTVSRIQNAELIKLAAENERLRLFNAREVRRYKKPAAKVNYSACADARHIMGTPASVIAAVTRQENGPPDIETGVLGKTDWIAKNYPIQSWASMETGRTLNIYAWDWLLHTEEGRLAFKKILKRASKSYTGDTLPEAWARNVATFQQEEAAKLKE